MTSAAHIYNTTNNCNEEETPPLQYEPEKQETKNKNSMNKRAKQTNNYASSSSSSSSSPQSSAYVPIHKTSAFPVITTWNESRTELSISVNSPVKLLHEQQKETTMQRSRHITVDVRSMPSEKMLHDVQNTPCKECYDPTPTTTGNNNNNSNSEKIKKNSVFIETTKKNDSSNVANAKERTSENTEHTGHDVNKVSKSLERNCNNGNKVTFISKINNTNTNCNFVQCANLQEPFTEPIKRIILVRNGLSEANVDVGKYVSTPDWRIPIVEEGKTQAIKTGRALATLIDNDPIYFYYSPYIRSRQSLRFILQGMSEQTELMNSEEQAESANEHELKSNAANRNLQYSHGVNSKEENTSKSEKHRLRSNRNSWGVDNENECNLTCHTWLSGNDTARESLFEACELSNELFHSSCELPEHTSTTTPSCTLQFPNPSYDNHQSKCNVISEQKSKEEERNQSQLEVNKCDSTASLLLSRSFDNIVGVREDVRLRDGDIGRYQSMDELIYHLEERERYGQFFYRFPHGESGADVCDRVTSFLDAFQRERVMMPMNTNVVIVTHGLAIRMFIARWFHLTVDTFHRMRSPPPGAICTLTRICHQSRFRLNEECLEIMRLPASLNDKNGYKYRNKQLLGSLSSGAPYM